VGVPVIDPSDESKFAQPGSPSTLKVSGSPSGSFAVGTKLYRLFSTTEARGDPEITGGPLGVAAVFKPSLESSEPPDRHATTPSASTGTRAKLIVKL
jgi:hypothetical protein